MGVVCCMALQHTTFGVLHDIEDHLADMEHQRIETDWRYRKAFKEHWSNSRGFGERGVREYVNNPFLRLADSSPSQYLVRRWEGLAAATQDNYRRSRVAAQKSISA